MATELQLPIPAGWEHIEPPQPDVLVIMRPPAPPASSDGDAEPLRPVAAITRLHLGASQDPPPERLLSHQRRLADQLCEILEWAIVEDADVHDLSGHDVSYLRIAHQTQGHALVTEVWTWILGDEEWSVTGTTPLEDYATWSDVFEAVAGAFAPEYVWQERRAG